MPVRDHQGLVLDKFNGLWNRGGDINASTLLDDTCPPDHFADCNNVDFVGTSAFRTRPGINILQSVNVPVSNIKRMYNYPTQNANTIIVLAYNKLTGNGEIYHVANPTTTYGPVLTVPGMTDFAFQPFAGRGYISPFGDYINGDLTFQKGLQGQVVYVYAGDGSAARQAAGAGLSGTMSVANGAAGFTDPGLHIFGIVTQTISGYNSPPSVLTSFNTTATSSVSFGSIPTSGDPNVVKRLLVATKVIPTFNGDLQGYQFFFVPDAVIDNNTDTFLNNISFYDADLLQDASSLLNNLTSIPAGAALFSYHNRLCIAATFTDISLIYVSLPGEPEAIDQIAGLIVVPLDGNPITNGQELRDVLYVFKRGRTVSYTDNGGDPSSWPEVVIDPGLGTSTHGIATVLDSGGANVDALIIATYQGISQFNGKYITPELSWKISNYWKSQDFSDSYGRIQIVNSTNRKKIYCVLPSRQLLVGDYGNGLNYKNIRWAPWSFLPGINSVAIQDINNILVGADLP